MSWNEAIAAFFVISGSLFSVIGGIGLLRFPDFYSRTHAAGMTDSAGAGAILFGLCFVSEPLVIIKLITVLAFLWLSSVASTHALVKAAHARGVRVQKTKVRDWTRSKTGSVHPANPADSAPSEQELYRETPGTKSKALEEEE